MKRILALLAILGAGNCSWGPWFFYDYPNEDGQDRHLGFDFDHGHDHDHDSYHHHDHDHDHDHDSYHNHDHDLTWEDEDSAENKDLWHASHDRRFDELSSYIVQADKYSGKCCKQYTNIDVQEIQEGRSYKLIYSLPQSDPSYITVKIKHRALYVYGRQSEREDASKYFDLRILPDDLKTQDAAWTHNGTHVTINIPYDLTLKSKLATEKICREVNENVITVPNVAPLDFRFGKD